MSIVRKILTGFAFRGLSSMAQTEGQNQSTRKALAWLETSFKALTVS